MERVVRDQNGISWTCIQAFTGLSEQADHHEAAQVKGQGDTYWVVCTPNGGTQSVRLQLSGNWQTEYSDADLLSEIESQSH